MHVSNVCKMTFKSARTTGIKTKPKQLSNHALLLWSHTSVQTGYK